MVPTRFYRGLEVWIQIGVTTIFTCTSNIPCILLEEGNKWKDTGSNNVTRNWWRGKIHTRTWGSDWNKDEATMKMSNYKVPNQMEENSSRICDTSVDDWNDTQMLQLQQGKHLTQAGSKGKKDWHPILFKAHATATDFTH